MKVGQQFHQYQQNEQSLLTFTDWTQKNKRPQYIPGTDLGQAQTCGEVKPVNTISTVSNVHCWKVCFV